MALFQSSGINITPDAVNEASPDGTFPAALAAPGPQAGQYQTSSLHLGINITADFDGEEIEMGVAPGTCGSGCRALVAPSLLAGADGDAEVEILRFAKHGRAVFKPRGLKGLGIQMANFMRRIRANVTNRPNDPIGATWLVSMEDGFPLTGAVSRTVLNSSPTPGRLKLGGRMVITLQTDRDSAPRRLKSKKEPILEGAVQSWPPKLAQLALTNAPIEYFDEREVDIPDAKPFLPSSRIE